MIRWVFLDVGNVLLDEDVLTYRVFARHVEAIVRARPELGFGRLLAEREALALSGSRWPVFEVASRYLEAPEVERLWEAVRAEVLAHYAEHHPPLEGAVEAVRALSVRFRLGLIANQPREARPHLERLGLLAHARVICLSEEVGLYKPDPALFALALRRAGVPPSACLMVGDRIDHDVAPARGLGMGAVLVRRPLERRKAGPGHGPDFALYVESSARIEAWRLADRCPSACSPSTIVPDLLALAREMKAWGGDRPSADDL